MFLRNCRSGCSRSRAGNSQRSSGFRMRRPSRAPMWTAADGQDAPATPDKHGSRGMAVKVLDVGDEVLAQDDGACNQDFLMINQPVFAFANAEDYLRLDRVLAAHDDDPVPVLCPLEGEGSQAFRSQSERPSSSTSRTSTSERMPSRGSWTRRRSSTASRRHRSPIPWAFSTSVPRPFSSAPIAS